MPNPKLVIKGTKNDREQLTELVNGGFPDAAVIANREALQFLTQSALRITERSEKPEPLKEPEEDEIE